MLRDLAALRKCSWTERGLLLEAVLDLVVMRIAVPVVPLRRIMTWLDMNSEATAVVPIHMASLTAGSVGWAVQVAAARLPRSTTCLMQALAAGWMLNSRHIPCAVHLGVGRQHRDATSGSTPDALTAHAWVTCGGQILVGAEGRERVTQLAVFASRPVPSAGSH